MAKRKKAHTITPAFGKSPQAMRYVVVAAKHAENRLPLEARQGNAYFTFADWEGAEERGRVDFIAPLYRPPVRGSGDRASLAAIREWCAKRKNIKGPWRNKDGSYNAVCTFRGPTAWDNAERAARSLPGLAYMAFRYLIDVRYAVELPHRSRSYGYTVKLVRGYELVPQSTHTVRNDNWKHARGELFTGESPDVNEDKRFNVGVLLTRAGLAVHWPGDASPSTTKPRKGKRRRRNKR